MPTLPGREPPPRSPSRWFHLRSEPRSPEGSQLPRWAAGKERYQDQGIRVWSWEPSLRTTRVPLPEGSSCSTRRCLQLQQPRPERHTARPGVRSRRLPAAVFTTTSRVHNTRSIIRWTDNRSDHSLTRLMSSVRNDFLKRKDGGNRRHRGWRHVWEKGQSKVSGFILLCIMQQWLFEWITHTLPFLRPLESCLMICCVPAPFPKSRNETPSRHVCVRDMYSFIYFFILNAYSL